MKFFTRIITATSVFALLFVLAAPQVQAQWTPCGAPLDFGDYYDDMPTTNPGDLVLQPTVSAQPNPSSGTFMRVVYSQLDKPGTLSLYDLSGRKFVEVAVGTTLTGDAEYKLPIAGLSPGTYILALSDGTQRVAQKVLVR